MILKLYHREIVIFIFEKLHNGWDLKNVNQRMFFDFSFKECLKPFENVEVVHTKWLLIINFEIEWCPSFRMGSSQGKWGKVHEDDNFFLSIIIGKVGQSPIGNKLYYKEDKF